MPAYPKMVESNMRITMNAKKPLALVDILCD